MLPPHLLSCTITYQSHPCCHHQAEELHHVVVPVQVQSLAQVGVALAQAQVVLVLPHLGDTGLAAPLSGLILPVVGVIPRYVQHVGARLPCYIECSI